MYHVFHIGTLKYAIHMRAYESKLKERQYNCITVTNTNVARKISLVIYLNKAMTSFGNFVSRTLTHSREHLTPS